LLFSDHGDHVTITRATTAIPTFAEVKKKLLYPQQLQIVVTAAKNLFREIGIVSSLWTD
jgi:hypothetical protein